MIRIIIPALVAISVLVGGSAWAIDKKGNYVPRFNYSCKDLKSFYKTSGLDKNEEGVTFNRSFGVIIGWMAGYISRVNQKVSGRADFFGNLADEATWLNEWCKLNPGGDLMEAMDALTVERTPKTKKKMAAKPLAKPMEKKTPAPAKKKK
jgi:hypothetical protein